VRDHFLNQAFISSCANYVQANGGKSVDSASRSAHLPPERAVDRERSMMGKRASSWTRTLGISFAFITIFCGHGAAAQQGCIADFANEVLRCPEGKVPLPQPPARPVPPTTENLPAALGNSLPGVTDESPAVVRDKFYQAIMIYVRQRKVTRGKPHFVGLPFERAYANADRPKALAICVNWTRSTPAELAFYSGSSQFQFVTGTGDCGPRDESQAKSCALSDCRRHAHCSQGETCAVVDVNDRNTLELPSEWERRYIRK
jgi:hypothetical protein